MGRRYNRETLEITYKGKNIADILDMTVDEAARFFRNVPQISDKLLALEDVGLGYVHLGQAGTTLTGGEAQRIKLAAELAKKATGRTVYILDEPTTGLHFADIHKLLEVLHETPGLRQYAHHHRAQSGGHKVRRLGDRYGAGRWHTGRTDHSGGHTGTDRQNCGQSYRGLFEPDAMRRLVITTMAFAAGCSLLHAQTATIEQARKALAENIPQVAVYKLRRFLDTPALAATEQNAARELLAEALLNGGQVEEALEASRKLSPTAENAVLRANIHAALGQWEEALRVYGECKGLKAQVGEVEALHALGRDLEAVALLEKLVNDGAAANPLRFALQVCSPK